MASSILTNNGAMTALQSLQATQKNLLETQNRISTGLKVSTAKDNAATWSVATSMRADIANFKQVSENLSVSAGVVSTAAAGTEQIAGLISKIRDQVTSLQDGVKNAKTVQASIDAYMGQINSIIDSSSFKGVNLVNGSRAGDTKLLASVNANGGAQVPTYITVGEQNLTMETGGQLNGLKGFSVGGVVDKWAFSAPAAASRMAVGDSVTFSFTQNGTSKTASFVNSTGAELAMDNVEDLDVFMKGMRDAINATAGAGNEIATLDSQGRLVVDNTRAKDTVAFDGNTALRVGIDAGTAITLGNKVDLAPQAPKFAYAALTSAPTGSTTYEFSFKVNGQDVVGSYTAAANTPVTDVMGGIRNAINASAGAGNEIASLDAAGNLVVDAALGKDEIAFSGASALKIQGGTLSTAGTAAAATYTYGATGVLTGIGVGTNTLTFALNVNGEDKSHTVTLDNMVAAVGGTAAVADYTADGAGAQALMEDLSSYINTLGYGSVASVTGTLGATQLVIDSSKGSFGQRVMGGVTAPGITVGGTGTLGFTTAVAANSAGTIAVGDQDQAARFTYGSSLVAGDVLKFEFTQNGATKTAQTTVQANQTKAEVLRALANSINAQAGVTVAAVDGDIGSEAIFVDGRRPAAAQQVTFSTTYANVLTGTLHSGDVTTATDQTVVKDTSYTGLLATLKDAETAVLSAGASFGAAQLRVDAQKDFVNKLVDTLTAGVGALVDADMSAEAARLQALQVQEQLGTQALSIANQAPQSILALFR